MTNPISARSRLMATMAAMGVSTLAGTLGPGAAVAQETSGATLGEIVVTGRYVVPGLSSPKQTQPLVETPQRWW